MNTGDHSRYGPTTTFLVCVTTLHNILVNNVHSWEYRRVNPNKCRYIRQGITIIGPHCKVFTDGLGTIIEV